MTFSIVAIDPKNRTLGVATATANTNVGDRVPYAKAGIGAIATQGLTEISYGINGLELLEMGYTPQEALEKMLDLDPQKELRQVIIIDIHNRKAVFTGENVIDFKGHIISQNYIVAGNLLANDNVLKEMVKGFERENIFVEKLLLALEAGKMAGGDIRGERSAALIIAGMLKLKVNNHTNPIKELKLLFNKQKKLY